MLLPLIILSFPQRIKKERSSEKKKVTLVNYSSKWFLKYWKICDIFLKITPKNLKPNLFLIYITYIKYKKVDIENDLIRINSYSF